MTKKNGKAGRPKKVWFAVKSLYRTEITDEPRVTDDSYDPEASFVEERVVLVRAKSHRKALSKARAEAKAYLLPAHVNPYGERVAWHRLKILDSFQMFEKPADCREVYSQMAVVPVSVSDEELETQRFGPVETKQAFRRRMRFLDREFVGDLVVDGPEAGEP